MILLLLLALLTPQELQVEGLVSGERFEVLPASMAPVPALERFDEGRVVDARTGFPVAGAQLEAWTEEISEPGAGFRRVGEATTGPDGLFRLRVQAGALQGDKVRVRAAGYLTLSTTAGDVILPLMPITGDPPLLRVCDLQDRPIPNARITSTYSCSHDVPAFDVRTDAFGIARLPEWGLQDQTPELRVRAEGYGAIEYVHDLDMLADLQMLREGEIPVVRLARRSPLRARVLDREGRPLGAAPLHIVDGEGYHVPFTADDGAFEILTPYGGTEVTLYALRHDGQDFVFAGPLPESRTVPLRLESQYVPQDEPLVDVLVQIGELEGSEPPPDLVLFHEDGWTDYLNPREGVATGSLPPGEALLLAGGAFSGWAEQLIELELVEGRPTEVQLDPRPEPTLTVLTPPGEAYRVVVQVGDDSIEDEPEKSGETTLSVPAGQPVTVLSEGDRTRRLTLPPLDADATADLQPESCLLPRSVDQRRDVLERTSLQVRFVAGNPAAPLEGELTVWGVGTPTASPVEAGLWIVEAAAGTPVLLRHGADGYAGLQTVAYATLPGEVTPELRLSPTPLASLAIEGDLDFEVSGPLADSLGALHPGPLTLEILLGGDRRVALALELQPGESRTLRLRKDD